jgi:DegV family protein with EDD domain
MSPGYILLTDSSCDLPSDYYKKHDIPFVSLEYTIDGVSYMDDAGVSVRYEDFYNRMRQGELSSTNMVNIGQYHSFFEPFLMQGKDILYLAFSSALSGSYASSVAAARELKEAYPDREILVVDSLCASLGEGLLLHYAIKLRDEGKSLRELYDWLENNKLHINHLFTVDSLMHLHRGGRLSITSAILGSLIGIKPVLNVSPQGSLVACGKVRGRQHAIERLESWMEELSSKKGYDTLMICHGDCIEEANFLADLLKKKFKVGEILINHIGPVIGSHVGPGTIGLFFMDKLRQAHV